LASGRYSIQKWWDFTAANKFYLARSVNLSAGLLRCWHNRLVKNRCHKHKLRVWQSPVSCFIVLCNDCPDYQGCSRKKGVGGWNGTWKWGYHQHNFIFFYGTESIWIFLETPPTHIILIDFSSTPPMPFFLEQPSVSLLEQFLEIKQTPWKPTAFMVFV